MVLQQVSLVERSSLSQSVPYRRFYCINQKVEFALEGGVDTGGPRRECFRLLASDMKDGTYFTAGTQGSFFVCNMKM